MYIEFPLSDEKIKENILINKILFDLVSSKVIMSLLDDNFIKNITPNILLAISGCEIREEKFYTHYDRIKKFFECNGGKLPVEKILNGIDESTNTINDEYVLFAEFAGNLFNYIKLICILLRYGNMNNDRRKFYLEKIDMILYVCSALNINMLELCDLNIKDGESFYVNINEVLSAVSQIFSSDTGIESIDTILIKRKSESEKHLYTVNISTEEGTLSFRGENSGRPLLNFFDSNSKKYSSDDEIKKEYQKYKDKSSALVDKIRKKEASMPSLTDLAQLSQAKNSGKIH